MKVDITIKNKPEIIFGRYMVLRQDNGSVWYYGAYADKEQAEGIARELGNGSMVERGIE